MYRKRADQLIVRDVRLRLAKMEEPDWHHAILLSWTRTPTGIGTMSKLALVRLSSC